VPSVSTQSQNDFLHFDLRDAFDIILPMCFVSLVVLDFLLVTFTGFIVIWLMDNLLFIFLENFRSLLVKSEVLQGAT
jgi:hypothetical protein